MEIEIDVKMNYTLGPGATACLVIGAADTDGQTVLDSRLETNAAELNRIDGEAGVGQRIWVQLSQDTLSLTYHARVDVSRANTPLESLAAVPLHQLPAEALSFLRPSRYCQSDMFPAFVARRFGDREGGAKVAAIRDWVAAEMAYVPASSGPATTVIDTFAAREGICRDYAHMVCALARASGIPARYASVYAPDVDPPDFHAVAEVWLDGGWQLVDATGMSRPDDIVLIAAGRDACDVAFLETSLPAQLVEQTVSVGRR
ncbi:Transglutaminase-like [Rhodovulum sp. P5]|uniref:transglutaminase-like domain-containing protein n=1 Tax=Rhodovulum sp. P5 TaxID=1564506 RepID=UPI0009C213DE|nr:transglutaminase domain-containing protein [Rhodovulum sp. P5]ARE39203.1 Transglutaminase-like [Rhodovulum sp. P5]